MGDKIVRVLLNIYLKDGDNCMASVNLRHFNNCCY